MKKTTIDGNEAAAYVSYAFCEVAAIYPITPSTPMAELADAWATNGKTNLFGNVPEIIEMQSESGVGGVLHGSLSCGALSTTYTCSQGLLMMLPELYKIAGELLPTVVHVSARALATHALSIFGDQQDAYACRGSGFALLASSSVQECMDLALIAHLATLESSVPFLHFFDGFRTSHEKTKIELFEYEEMKSLVNEEHIAAFRARALSPDSPIQRGTAQNPDIYFQNREAANVFYARLPDVVQKTMDKVAKVSKRAYHVFDYYGDERAERVIVTMGSGGSAMEETVEALVERGERVGLVKVRLYRPFDGERFLAALPESVKKIAVLDRAKEAGSIGEPLYLDVVAALADGGKKDVIVVGGRYGLSSKQFTPTDCYAVLKNLERETPKNGFTVGILDDLSHTSLDVSEKFTPARKGVTECKFYGLGSDGTVGANKQSVEIIGENTELYAQAYFCYDSKKSGGITVSHLRFGKEPIRSSYLIDDADFISCHDPSYLARLDTASNLKENGIYLLNCPCDGFETLNSYLPPTFKRKIARKRAKLYVINATRIANEVGLKGRTSVIMQAAFFLLTPSILPYERAKALLKEKLSEKFRVKGENVVRANLEAVERAEKELTKVDYPKNWENEPERTESSSKTNDEYFQKFIEPILTLRGNELPTSAFNADGSVPTGTSKFEKRGVARVLPKWLQENCIQCNQCSFVCPHSCIRPFVFDENTETPEDFVSRPAIGLNGKRFRIQISPLDCTGCGVCVNECPAKEKALATTPSEEIKLREEKNWEFALALPQTDTSAFKRDTVKGSQLQVPLFEFSYACAGCGETPYVKLLTQLFGERTVIANATGCSSIYGGSAPTCPYTKNRDGKGPAWANSLFEDVAEFGLGMRLALDSRGEKDKCVWIVGGDGWAYDIGYGGLDHVLASGANVNVLVLDSEVYSNTGGQASKATQTGAVARFTSKGKESPKKKLGLIATTYGNVYVAQVAMGANKQRLIAALTEAESYVGPSLVIAYSPCIAHGVSMTNCMDEQRLAVESGYWHLFRFDPRLKEVGKSPFVLDSKAPSRPLKDFLLRENRFAALYRDQPERAEALFARLEKESRETYELYRNLSEIL